MIFFLEQPGTIILVAFFELVNNEYLETQQTWFVCSHNRTDTHIHQKKKKYKGKAADPSP